MDKEKLQNKIKLQHFYNAIENAYEKNDENLLRIMTDDYITNIIEIKSYIRKLLKENKPDILGIVQKNIQPMEEVLFKQVGYTEKNVNTFMYENKHNYRKNIDEIQIIVTEINKYELSFIDYINFLIAFGFNVKKHISDLQYFKLKYKYHYFNNETESSNNILGGLNKILNDKYDYNRCNKFLINHNLYYCCFLDCISNNKITLAIKIAQFAYNNGFKYKFYYFGRNITFRKSDTILITKSIKIEEENKYLLNLKNMYRKKNYINENVNLSEEEIKNILNQFKKLNIDLKNLFENMELYQCKIYINYSTINDIDQKINYYGINMTKQEKINEKYSQFQPVKFYDSKSIYAFEKNLVEFFLIDLQNQNQNQSQNQNFNNYLINTNIINKVLEKLNDWINNNIKLNRKFKLENEFNIYDANILLQTILLLVLNSHYTKIFINKIKCLYYKLYLLNNEKKFPLYRIQLLDFNEISDNNSFKQLFYIDFNILIDEFKVNEIEFDTKNVISNFENREVVNFIDFKYLEIREDNNNYFIDWLEFLNQYFFILDDLQDKFNEIYPEATIYNNKIKLAFWTVKNNKYENNEVDKEIVKNITKVGVKRKFELLNEFINK